MNTTTPPGLPELTDARRDAVEAELFRRIAADTRPRRRPGARRWLAPLSAAAAVLVVAGVVGGVLGDRGPTGASSADAPVVEQHAGGGWTGDQVDSGVMGATEESAPMTGTEGADDADDAREVVATASAWLETDDAADAVDALSRKATERGGYVESSGISGAPDAQAVGDALGERAEAWITVRVPADQLQPLLAGLPSFGRVLSSEVDRTDVTLEAADLRARVEALDASVARLTELIGQAATTSDLLAAEAALSERQPERDALRAQLTALEGRVALSSLTVTLSEPHARPEADPEGFGDGLATGWAALVAVWNAVVIGLGFLLPWLIPAAAVAAVVVAIRRRRRRAARSARSEQPVQDG